MFLNPVENRYALSIYENGSCYYDLDLKRRDKLSMGRKCNRVLQSLCLSRSTVTENNSKEIALGTWSTFPDCILHFQSSLSADHFNLVAQFSFSYHCDFCGLGSYICFVDN